ncbi:probable RNA helicase armi isoform X2 [Nilaparvata lugens]|nr:probable RNA helicase armi isoform X2 [Nilaparvata lugens]XP_039285071.1 probable RNA helicase armi isoform X2 [Nilaparvata lugens]
MLVEESADSLNGCGEILEIVGVMPLRYKMAEGVVTHWRADKKVGIINRETYFSLDACEIGYMPVVGDEIDAHIIESNQGSLSWRALKVIPSTERTSYKRKNDSNFWKSMLAKSQDSPNDLLDDKFGITISKKCNFGKLQYGHERDMIVELKNSSKMVHQLESVGFCNKFQSQIKLIEPVFQNNFRFLQIQTGETIKFVFRCQAKFYGNAEELVVWNFQKFNIGRFLRVEVDDDYLREVKNHKYQRKPKVDIDRENLIPTKHGFVVNGVRSSQKAPFIPIKLALFKVPDQFWDIMADNTCTYHELLPRLISAIPCLDKQLTPANYRERWHALLYVEEVNSVLQLRSYDMRRVQFRPSGEHLVLEVPGVQEKRPSLIVGDAVYATPPLGAPAPEIGIKYEGFIHKIVRNDLYIKFNPNFHQCFDEKDYDVSFVSNRAAFRKCHQAVNVAYKNLTTSWLFPSSLKPSPPLFVPEDDTDNVEDQEQESVDDVEQSQSTVSENETKNIEVNGNCEETVPKLSNGVEELFKKVSQEKDGQLLASSTTQQVDTSTKLSNGVEELFKKVSQDQLSTSSPQTDISPNLKDLIFKMPLKNANNGNVVASNMNETDNVNKCNRLPVADWLSKTSKKRRNLMDFLNMDEEKNTEMTACQNGNQAPPFPGQIQTLEEVEKQMMMKSPPKNMVTLSEIEKPLLDKSRSFTVEENSKKVAWNDDSSIAKKAVVKDVKVEECQVKVKLVWFNTRLNYYQKEAVRRILRNEARPLPYIIFGPPGTGKTVTLVETALQILSLSTESRLLIASPSNSAADCISEKLIDTGFFPVGTLARLCSLTYMSNERCSEKLAPYCTSAEFRVRSGEQTFINEDGLRSSTRQALGRHRVTVGTCVTLGSLYNMGFPQGHFTHVLVDEAGQATEPEILVPLSLLDNKTGQSVLVGDPQQLGPVIFSRHAKQLGLGTSLIGRLLDSFPYCRDARSFPTTHGFDPRLVTQLVDNYRSLPEILKLPSQMFYEDRLVPHVPEDGLEASLLMRLKAELPPRKSTANILPPALVFHGVKGLNYQEDDSPSWFNPHEVVQTIAYVMRLISYGLKGDDIGIITPYNKQAFKIRQLLTKLELSMPKVGSVEEFQGQERLVILLSTVRTTRDESNVKQLMGFISSPQRLNVGLTRARALLVIIGDPHLLVHDPYWRTVLDYCIKRDAYCGCEAPVARADDDRQLVD